MTVDTKGPEMVRDCALSGGAMEMDERTRPRSNERDSLPKGSSCCVLTDVDSRVEISRAE
jgi:hypothetical protein